MPPKKSFTETCSFESKNVSFALRFAKRIYLNSVMIDTIIKLPSTCANVGEVEEVINAAFQETPLPELIRIDMGNVVYITAPCMIYLIATTNNLLSKNIEVRFHLPTDKGVRDILRIWRFAVVMKEVTGKGFASMVRTEDIQYFGESPLSGDYYDKFANNDEGLAELMKKDFFSITSVPFEDDKEKSLAIDNQHKKWSEEIIKSILKRHLAKYDGENENIIPNRIIYECMTNSFRHSEAVKLITGAYFDKVGKVLTITYWDNGDSIVSTLKKALEENKVARNKEAGDEEKDDSIHFTLYVKSDNMDDENIKKYYHSDDDPTEEDSHGEILLAAPSPGVSRDPFGKIKYQGNPYLSATTKKFNKPGMGLTTLMNAAIDLLDGAVVIRTGNYFVNFKKPKESIKKSYVEESGEFKHETLYQAKIARYNEKMPVFNGNMITIRLPLKKV